MDYRPTTIESSRRGWMDAFAGLFMLLSLLLFPITWPLYQIRRYYGLRFKGFWVAPAGRDAIEYEEIHYGKVQGLSIGVDMVVKGPSVVYVPTEVEWQQTMPQWALGRRDQIIENVKRQLGTKNYEYDFSEP